MPDLIDYIEKNRIRMGLDYQITFNIMRFRAVGFKANGQDCKANDILRENNTL